MFFKRINTMKSLFLVPLAIFALMFNARCADDNNNINDQIVLALLNLEGGTMALKVDSNATKFWTRCRATNYGTYWEVVGSGGSETIRLYFGKLATTHTYTGSTSTNKASGYVEYISGATSFLGVTEYSGSASSSITITTDGTTIIGSFSGVVYNSLGTISHTIDGISSFDALK